MTEADGTRRGGGVALRVLAFLILALLATAVIVAQQRGAGAHGAEPSAAHAGEARHFVTGLMVARHWEAGRPALEGFAADYRLRLPEALAPASWSLFHLVEGAWLRALEPTAPAALLLVAALAALLVVATGWAGAGVAGVLPGVAAAFVLAALPLFKAATLEVGLDLPLALLLLLAALACARAAACGGRADAGLFALAGAAAVATAPGGAAVLLIPPLAAAFGGGPGPWRRPLLAAMAFLAVLAAALALASGARPVPAGGTALAGAWAALKSAFGLLPLAGAAAGLLFAAAGGWRADAAAVRAAPVAALVPAWAIALLLGAGAGRDLDALPFAAPVALLAAFGAVRLMGLLVSGWTLVSGLVVALVLLLAAMPGLLRELRKETIGMDGVAAAVLARDAAPPVVVVAGDAAGEAALVAAVAERDRDGRAFVVEAGSLRAEAGAPFLAVLDEMGATALAIETRGAATRATAARAAVEAHPDRFRLAGTFPRGDKAGEVRLYWITRAAPAPADPAPAIRRATRPAG